MAYKSLSDFIKNYLKGKKKTDDSDGYEVWAANNLSDSVGISGALRSVKTGELKSSPKYGKLAENLARGGLNSGGYSKFIKDRAAEERRESENAAYEKSANDSAKAVASYESYLKEKNEAYEKLLKRTVSEISSYNVMNIDEAIEIAKERGLSDKDAESAAKTATDAVRRRLRKTVSERIISQRLTESQTYDYARSLGLSEIDARDLANYARDINDYIS